MIVRIVALVLLVVLAGCGQHVEPSGLPAEQRFGAPFPAAPRDVRPASVDPCRSLLTPAELRELGFDPTGDLATLPTGEMSCDWRGLRRVPHVNVGVAGDRDILVDTYRTRQFTIFRPTSIGGLPATVEQASHDSISCNVTVGTAQGQGFLTIYDGVFNARGQPDNPCGKAQQIAERIVAALPPLSK